MTITSTWGDWLATVIAEAAVETVSLWYLGCNGVALKTAAGTTMFIDPYFGRGTPPRTTRMIPIPLKPDDVRTATAILTTHEHSDHVHGPSQAPILANTGATLYGSDAVISRIEDEAWSDRWTCKPAQFERVSPGSRIQCNDVVIRVERAHDPLAAGPLAYVIEHAAGTVFHGGDTRHDETVLSPIGSRYDIDLGFIAYGSSGLIPDKQTGELRPRDWYCDANEVIAACQALRLDRLIPTHWDMWKGLLANPATLHAHRRSFPYPKSIEVLQIGDRLDL